MNQKAIWGIVVVVVIVIIAIFAFQGGAPEEGDSAESFSGSIKDLLARGKNVTCTFESAQEGINISGTVYVSGERVRGDYKMTQGETGTFETHTIVDSDWVYTWGDTPVGTIATKIAVGEEEPEQVEGQPSTAPDADQDFEYSCSRWSVDNSVFDLPAGVDFQELNFKAGDGESAQGPGAPIVDCSACDQVPEGAARDQCLQALGC